MLALPRFEAAWVGPGDLRRDHEGACDRAVQRLDEVSFPALLDRFDELDALELLQVVVDALPRLAQLAPTEAANIGSRNTSRIAMRVE